METQKKAREKKINFRASPGSTPVVPTKTTDVRRNSQLDTPTKHIQMKGNEDETQHKPSPHQYDQDTKQSLTNILPSHVVNTQSPPSSPPYNFSYVTNSPISEEYRVTHVNCTQLLYDNESEWSYRRELKKGKYTTIHQLPPAEVEVSIYMELRNSCSDFKRRRGYILHHMTEEERDFPIAMSILLFKEFHQVEHLMRFIYRPQNFYCLHVDYTSDSQLRAVVAAYADCFPNIIVPRDLIDVVWGAFSLSEAEFVCMYELLRMGKWRYFINLTGQEFPLKTNWQIVKIFKAFNGANDIWTSPMHAQGQSIVKRYHRWGPPPHDIHITKGSHHVTFTREMVEFITGDERVSDLATFLDKAAWPEEGLWATLNDDKGLVAPGGFNGTLEESINKTWNGRVKWWIDMRMGCHGFYKRNICVFGVGDMSRLVRDAPIFANKFYWNYQPIALHCMREWMFNRTRDEYLGLYTFDATEYGKLPNVLRQFRRRD